MDGWLRQYERGGADPIALGCPECGREWEAATYREYGSIFLFDDNDELCPECEAEGVER